MTRNEVLHLVTWLVKDEFGEGHEEEITDKYLQEIQSPMMAGCWDGK